MVAMHTLPPVPAFGISSGKDKPQYIRSSRAWYWDPNDPSYKGLGIVDELLVGIYDQNGRSTGEFTIREVTKGIKSGERWLKIEMYDDAWHVIGRFQDFLWRLSALQENKDLRAVVEARNKDRVTLDDVEAILKAAGVTDRTETRDPKATYDTTRNFARITITSRRLDAPPQGTTFIRDSRTGNRWFMTTASDRASGKYTMADHEEVLNAVVNALRDPDFSITVGKP